MPWSAKARELIQRQYAPVAAAGENSLAAAVKAVEMSPAAHDLAQSYRQRLELLRKYREAYRRYCWPVNSLADYRLAPFHLLASEGAVHVDKTHRWHMETLHRLAQADPEFIRATPFLEVDVADESAVASACQWWEELTGKGGEGMVVKPLDFIAQGPKGVVQRALKCRGREYLRIIYGPEYTADDQLPKLRKRGVAGKRALANREFALGIEALDVSSHGNLCGGFMNACSGFWRSKANRSIRDYESGRQSRLVFKPLLKRSKPGEARPSSGLLLCAPG